MSYTPTEWKSGDIVTAAKLNHIEDGIASAGGVMVVSSTFDERTEIVTLGKTWQEIFNAIKTGVLCVAYFEPEENVVASSGLIISAQVLNNEYSVYVLFANESAGYAVKYTTTSADGYPSVED